MQNRKYTSILLSIIFSLAFLITPAVSLSGASIYGTSGKMALASFNFLDSSGCLITDFYIAPYISTETSGQGIETSPIYVSVTLARINTCTNTQAIGVAISGDVQFKMDQATMGAALNGTIPICLYTWPDPTPSCTTLVVNLAWSGEGPAYRESFNHRFLNLFIDPTIDGRMITERYAGMFREALVTGDVFDGTTKLTPSGAFQYGFLGHSQQRQLVIY